MSTKTVLVVDDELGSAEILAMILDEAGFKAYSEVNGRLALERAGEVIPDVIVTDYMMPLMNGAELARALRADDRFSKTRIILTSALPEFSLSGCIDGYDAYIRKPFKVDSLLALLEQCFGR